jgi:hypothetical protein
MSLTTAQETTLAAAIKANPDCVAWLPTRVDSEIAAYYNANSTFIVWRSSLTPAQARAAISGGDGLAQLDNLTVGKRDALLWVFGDTTSPANTTQRAAIESLCGTQNQLKAAILAAQKRAATKAERLFATGTGSDASPGTLGWEGALSVDDVSRALNANP